MYRMAPFRPKQQINVKLSLKVDVGTYIQLLAVVVSGKGKRTEG